MESVLLQGLPSFAFVVLELTDDIPIKPATTGITFETTTKVTVIM